MWYMPRRVKTPLNCGAPYLNLVLREDLLLRVHHVALHVQLPLELQPVRVDRAQLLLVPLVELPQALAALLDPRLRGREPFLRVGASWGHGRLHSCLRRYFGHRWLVFAAA